MKSEALDAIANKTMRPEALDAAASLNKDSTPQSKQESNDGEKTQAKYLEPSYDILPRPSTPFGQRTDGTMSAAKAIEDIAHGVKLAVDGALDWVEKKADDLSEEKDGTGPYASPATCAPTDLDPIASGLLPAMPTQKVVDDSKTAADGEDDAAHAEHEKRDK